VLVEEVELGDLEPIASLLALHEDLVDERRDGFDGARKGDERDEVSEPALFRLNLQGSATTVGAGHLYGTPTPRAVTTR